MNNQILKNDEQNHRIEESSAMNVQSKLEKDTNEKSNGAVCKNGVCLVTWKPQRPAAA